MICDPAEVLEGQIAAMRDLPHSVPAWVVMQMSARSLAHLDAAADTPHYHLVLAAIVSKIEGEAA